MAKSRQYHTNGGVVRRWSHGPYSLNVEYNQILQRRNFSWGSSVIIHDSNTLLQGCAWKVGNGRKVKPISHPRFNGVIP